MILRQSKRGPFLAAAPSQNAAPPSKSPKLPAKILKSPKHHPRIAGRQRPGRRAGRKTKPASPPNSTTAKPAPSTTDIDCDECGKPMIIRSGRRGKFLGCSGYPKCKNTAEVPAKLLEELGLAGNNGATNGQAQPPTPPKETDHGDHQ